MNFNEDDIIIESVKCPICKNLDGIREICHLCVGSGVIEWIDVLFSEPIGKCKNCKGVGRFIIGECKKSPFHRYISIIKGSNDKRIAVCKKCLGTGFDRG